MNAIINDNPFLGKRVLVVTAHPDDESLTAAGTLQQIVSSGGEVYILCATQGERGKAYMGREVTNEELAELRKAELLEAAHVMGVTNVEVLDFPDGELSMHIQTFAAIVAARIQRYEPDCVIGFGPDGITAHTDHIAAFTAAFSVCDLHKVPYAAFTLPPEPLRARFVEVLQKKRKFGLYAECEELKLPTIALSVDKELKFKVVQAHQTQLEGLNPHIIFDADMAEHILMYEYFHIA